MGRRSFTPNCPCTVSGPDRREAVSPADADLDFIKHVLVFDHLPRTVSSLDGADVEDGNGHQEGGGGEDHGAVQQICSTLRAC